VRQIIGLALADLAADRLFAICQVLALAAVLAPLLVLAGLREGALAALVDRLDRDPAMRLIQPEAAGARRYDPSWFARMRERPDVAFAMPATRFIAAQVDLVADGEPLRVSLRPTGPGDPAAPLTGPWPEGIDHLALGAATAARLGVVAGGSVRLLVERVRDGLVEPAVLRLAVVAIARVEADDGMAAYVVPELAQAIEAFRDGVAVPRLGWPGTPTPVDDAAPLFRLYARTIADVAPLVAVLAADGVGAIARTTEIEAALALRRNLTTVLAIVAALGLAGYVVALVAAQWAAAVRKRGEMAVLALVGFSPARLAAFPMIQGLAMAAAGAILALVLFAAAAATINAMFADAMRAGEVACRLSATQMLGAVAGSLSLSVPAALMAARLFARLDPAEELRRA
jgi:putative ABC transport system permease protein